MAGLLSFLGDIAGGLLGLGAQSSANAANMELAKYSFDRNVEMWNMQNDYNTPSAQMERLRAAGLNPNLVYGSGSVAGNSSGSSPSYQAPRVQPVTSGAFVSDAVRSGLFTDAQLKNMHAQTSYTDTQADVAKARISEIAAQTAESLQRTARSKFDLGLAQELRNNSIDVAKANLENIKSTTEYTNVRIQLGELDKMLMPLKTQLTQKQIDNLSVATESALWELQMQYEGKFVGHDVLSQLANQVIRWANDQPSLFDSASKLLDKIKGDVSSNYNKWWMKWPRKGSGVR